MHDRVMSGEYYCMGENARTGHGQTDNLTDIIYILAENARTGHGQTDILTDIIYILIHDRIMSGEYYCEADRHTDRHNIYSNTCI